SNAKSFLAIRGKNYFGRILRNVRAFRDLQEREGKDQPRVSAWLTGLKETIAELPAFVHLAAEIGVREVYLQRLVFFGGDAIRLRPPKQRLQEAKARGGPPPPRAPTGAPARPGIPVRPRGRGGGAGHDPKAAGGRPPRAVGPAPRAVVFFPRQ